MQCLSSSLRTSTIEHSTLRESDPKSEEGKDKPVLMMLLYIYIYIYTAGISDRIRKAHRNYNIRVVFISSLTFRSLLTKVKDFITTEKQDNVAYKVPCMSEMVYIGKTKCCLETRLMEHKSLY